MKIEKGRFVVIDVETVSPEDTSPGNEGGSNTGDFTELESPPDKVEAPPLEPGKDIGTPYERSLDVQKKSGKREITSKESLGKGESKDVSSAKWQNALQEAINKNSSSLSEKARRLIQELKQYKPKVDWKKELKKFMDQSMSKWEDVLPNRRMLAGGDVLYGVKPSGQDTLKTLVLPVDTSGSISKEQIKTFISEVFSLSTKYDIEMVYIVYTSDTIDSIDVVPKGKKPDLSMIRTTGGNQEGFYPPFRFIQNPTLYQGKANAKLPKSINPSAVIYFTDTKAEYPSRNDFGISKYSNRVFWFICLSEEEKFNDPPFGKYLHMPIDKNGNFI